MKISFYFVIHKIIAYAGRLHFDFCGHCGRDTGYFSDSLAHIPQEKLTTRPRRDPGLFFLQTPDFIFLFPLAGLTLNYEKNISLKISKIYTLQAADSIHRWQ